MTTISVLRAGLAAALEDIPDLTVLATMPGSVNAPMAVVTPAAGTFLTYQDSMSGTDRVSLTVTLFVSYAHQEQAQTNLDGYLADAGAHSILAAVQTDPTLGGVADFAVVTEARNYGIVTVANVDYLSCELGVDVGSL